TSFERAPEQGWRAKNLEELGRDCHSLDQSERSHLELEGRVVASVRSNAAESWKMAAQIQEFRFIPRVREVEHAHLFFMGDRQRLEEQRSRDAEDCSDAARAERQREHREHGVGRTPHQPAHGVTKIDDPALDHWSSRPHAICPWFETGHAAPPDAAYERW